MPRLLVALAAALAALLLSATAASAATDPYPSRATGSDDGPAQCGGAPRGAFAVVAVNAGRPFSANPCFSTQAAGASGGFYVNTGYARAYADRITATCRHRAAGLRADATVREAYAIGCSEAQRAEAVVAASDSVPAAWWLDVETANSWEDVRVDLNQAALQGIVDELRTTDVPVGVYSTAEQWTLIAGPGWSPAGLDAVWVAGARSPADAPRHCESSFASAPVWLVQYVAGLDQDYAC